MNINVVGTSGSGKSTLARRLAHRLGLPWIELDRLYWRAKRGGAHGGRPPKIGHIVFHDVC